MLELRAIRMRERVMNEVSTHPGEANQMQNLPLPGWAPELSTMIASATAKAAAEAVVNAIPLSGVQGNRPPQFRQANGRGRGCWSFGSKYHFQRNCPKGKLPQGGGQTVNVSRSPPGDQVPVIRISSIQPNILLLDCKIKGVTLSAVVDCGSPICILNNEMFNRIGIGDTLGRVGSKVVGAEG